MKASLQAWWQQRAPREQQALRWGAAALAILLGLTLLVLPVIDRHARLAQQLPGLREQLQRMEQQAAEVQQLQATAGADAGGDPASPAGTATAANVEALARGTGLREQMDPFSLLPDGHIQIGMARVGFDAFLDWTDRLRRGAGYHVVRLDADALDSPGMVRLKATLAPIEDAGPAAAGH